MRTQPLTLPEIEITQEMFNVLPDDKKQMLLDWQSQIENHEGVDMEKEVKGGIPFEHWCQRCKIVYSVMYKLIKLWYVDAIRDQIEKLHQRPLQNPNRPKDYPGDYPEDLGDHPIV